MHRNQGYNEPCVKEKRTLRKKIFNKLGLIKNSKVLFSYSPAKKSSHYKNIAALCLKFQTPFHNKWLLIKSSIFQPGTLQLLNDCHERQLSVQSPGNGHSVAEKTPFLPNPNFWTCSVLTNWLKKRFAKADTLFPANWKCLCSYVAILFQNWMVFETIHRPLFAESKQVNFPNNSPVSTNYNGAFCKVGSELVL